MTFRLAAFFQDFFQTVPGKGAGRTALGIILQA